MLYSYLDDNRNCVFSGIFSDIMEADAAAKAASVNPMRTTTCFGVKVIALLRVKSVKNKVKHGIVSYTYHADQETANSDEYPTIDHPLIKKYRFTNNVRLFVQYPTGIREWFKKEE